MRCLLWLTLAPLIPCSTAPGAELALPEPRAKAAFLFNFPKYVEWPPTAFGPNDPIIICIVGDDEIALATREIALNKTIAGRPVVVHEGVPADVQKCHLLFIANSQKATAPALLRALQSHPTLTVADFENFLDAGGMITLTTKGTRIQMHVNLFPAQRARLVLNSKMLALAESVRGKPQR